MRKPMIIFFIFAILTVYSCAVYYWWMEGNFKDRIQRVENQSPYSNEAKPNAHHF